jgi:hypothetical protein
MSGSDGQPSVWNALDRVSFSFTDNMNAVSVSSTAWAASAGVAHPDNSIMLCAPLIIDENTKVELAEYRLVQVPLDLWTRTPMLSKRLDGGLLGSGASPRPHPPSTAYEGNSCLDSQLGQDFRAVCMVGLQDVSFFFTFCMRVSSDWYAPIIAGFHHL